jgi:hypothetical protein
MIGDIHFFDIPERTEFSDEAFGVMGRALCVTQHFEVNCKGLASILDIKSKIIMGKANPLDSKKFAKIVKKLLKRSLGRNINQLKDVYGLPNDLYNSLDEGRKARNEIAHSITIGLEYTIESDTGRKEIVDNLKDCATKIMEADKIVACLLQVFNHEQMPNKEYLDSYSQDVTNWVCEIYDD